MIDCLSEFFENNFKFALAFSGGVDSSYLLYRAKESGADFKAYFMYSQFQPEFELRSAQALAEHIGVSLTVLEIDALALEAIAVNDRNRCYHCKRNMFMVLLDAAARDGYSLVIDGTNASDDAGDRPGMRALGELGIRSPLRECGLDKASIRARSRIVGLPCCDKPAYSCLATRVSTGQRLDARLLEELSASEAFLFGEGFTDFRIRVIGRQAMLQFTEAQLPLAFSRREKILAELSSYFDVVSLDIKARRESL